MAHDHSHATGGESNERALSRAQALGISANAKKCYLFNPPSIDRQWTVPREPKAPIAEPMKMCRISNSVDGMRHSSNPANAEKRKVASGR